MRPACRRPLTWSCATACSICSTGRRRGPRCGSRPAPGAGKTALAAAWAESRWRPADLAAVLWYAVEETDADPLRAFATLGGFLGLAHGFGTDIPPEPTPEAFAEIAGGGAALARRDAATPSGRTFADRVR